MSKTPPKRYIEKDWKSPLLSKEELQLFSETAKTANRYFEFGSGGSTIYVAENTDAWIYCVDSSREWLDSLSNHLHSRANVTYKHVDIGPTQKMGMPSDDSKKHLWPNYSNALQDSGFEPDLVFVDGRFRPACILKTIRYALDNKLNTKIMLHDCQRKEYNITYKYLNKLELTRILCVFEIKQNANLEEVNLLITELEMKPK